MYKFISVFLNNNLQMRLNRLKGLTKRIKNETQNKQEIPEIVGFISRIYLNLGLQVTRDFPKSEQINKLRLLVQEIIKTNIENANFLDICQFYFALRSDLQK